MLDSIKEKLQEAIRKIEMEQQDPRLLVVGATGAGKSSLINAIFGKKLNPVRTIESTTRDFQTHDFEVELGAHILITDSPGYGEVGYDRQYSRSVVEEAKKCHAITLVLKADEKGYERDRDIVREAGRDPDFPLQKPVLIALNQIDKLNPVRVWSPPYELDRPIADEDSEKVRHIKAKIDLVKGQFAGAVADWEIPVIPTMSDPDEGMTFGIDRFKIQLFKALPEVARYRFARVAKLSEKASQDVLDQLEHEANSVIAIACAAAAGAVAVNPIPISDYLVVSPIQIGMVVRIGAIYGKSVDSNSAMEVLMTLGTGYVARTLFQGIISLIPGVKSFLGPPFAAAATHGIGVAAKYYFKKGALPSPAELTSVIQDELKRREADKK